MPINRNKNKLIIRAYPDPILRETTEDISEITEDIRELPDKMFSTLEETSGLGLAAPQVGHSISLFIAKLSCGNYTFINPMVDNIEGENIDIEGCMSFPLFSAKVSRATKLRIIALNLENEEFILDLEDMDARVIQHEMDHLSGKLIIDYASTLEKIIQKGRLNSIEKNYKVMQYLQGNRDILNQKKHTLKTKNKKKCKFKPH